MILYHYCSNEAFRSIIDKKAIWLSSLSLTNDPMEGKWLHKARTSDAFKEAVNAFMEKRTPEFHK